MTNSAFYVYAYFRLDGSPCYVGKGKGERWRHRGSYGRNVHFVRIHAQAKRLGQVLPCVKLIEGLSEREALDLEAFFIAAIGREVDGGPLVNLTVGGETGPTGYKWTAEQRRNHKPRLGKLSTPESRALVSAKLKGRPKTPEHIANAAAARRGVKNKAGWWSTEEGRAKQKANNPRYGAISPHSEETKAKIRAARALQTNFGKRSKDYQPSAETRAKLSAAATADWAARKSDATRMKVTISSSWASQNSVRFPVMAA